MESVKVSEEDSKVIDGLPISASQVRRLERECTVLQEKLDTLQIKKLTKHSLETDQAKVKADDSKIKEYQDDIKKKEQQIITIRLYL